MDSDLKSNEKESRSCITCVYFEAIEESEGELEWKPAKKNYGICRKNAPSTSATRSAPINTTTKVAISWPSVNEKDWCGEHRSPIIFYPPKLSQSLSEKIDNAVARAESKNDGSVD